MAYVCMVPIKQALDASGLVLLPFSSILAYHPVGGSCHLSLRSCTRAIDRSSRAVYRSILVLTSLANTRAGQSGRRLPSAPIRTPEWSSRLSGQRRILFTQPRGTPEHERHLGIKCPNTFFRLIYLPSCHLDLGGSRHGWRLFRLDETEYLQPLH